jgi:hypothetical protein
MLQLAVRDAFVGALFGEPINDIQGLRTEWEIGL